MIFWLALPAMLLLATAASIVAQQLFTHFVDLRRLERHLGLTFALWLSLGWFLEAQAAERVATLYVECATRLETRVDVLWDDVLTRIGGR